VVIEELQPFPRTLFAPRKAIGSGKGHGAGCLGQDGRLAGRGGAHCAADAAQYDAIDPDNRLVAAELEKRWNDRLAVVRNLETELEGLTASPLLISHLPTGSG
jgi:hypothetical protein